jgi:hypothetical protein
MGLSNSPAVFSAMMNRIFGPYLDDFVIVYLDDLVIYSTDLDTHMKHLEIIFKVMREHTLCVKRSKCTFGVEKVEFCGHTISKRGVEISKDKILAMSAPPVIKNAKDVRSYLGSCVWFHRFIPDYAAITAPLSRLIKKNVAFKWGPEQEEAIQLLQHLITTAPVLRHFDHRLPTEVYTDASDYAIGGWIAQQQSDGWHPATYWSRKLTTAELGYTVHEKELLAIVEMTERHSHWLLGVPFVVHTDHASLKHLQDQPKLNRRQARWIMTLQDFDMTIK